MYLSDRDLKKAIKTGKLIVEPKPEHFDPTSIDLHLDSVEQAKVWYIENFADDRASGGDQPKELRIGKFNYVKFSPRYLKPPTEDKGQLVFRRGTEIVVKPNGFVTQPIKNNAR
jgi:deoxycytidine triphosphate deaminase